MLTLAEQVKSYRLRADELRTAVESVRYPDNRETFLRIAREFELMADNLETKNNLKLKKTP